MVAVDTRADFTLFCLGQSSQSTLPISRCWSIRKTKRCSCATIRRPQCTRPTNLEGVLDVACFGSPQTRLFDRTECQHRQRLLGCGRTRHAGGARPAACLFGIANKHWGSNCRITRVCRLPAGSKGEGTAARASSVGIHGIQRYVERLALHPTDCYNLASAKRATGCLDLIRLYIFR